MKKVTFLMVVIVAALLVSSLAFAQTYEKVIKMSEGMGEGMHKGCSQMGNMMPEMMMKCCKMNPDTKGMSCGMGSGMMMGCCGEGMRGEMMGCCKKEFFLCCKEKLELTDEQVKSLKSIKMDFMKADIQKEADLKVAQLELKELMSADMMDMAKVGKMIKNIHTMKAEKKIAHLKAFEKAKGVLTPEQLKKQKEQHMMMKGM